MSKNTLSERLLGRLAKAEPTRREILLGTFVLFVLLLVGSVGYTILEGWSLMDGLYMTFITLTTIGFTEVQPLSMSGRVFTIGIAIMGIGTVAFIATRSAQLLIATQSLRQRHIERTIRRMRNHYIVCGYGRIGKRIAQDLQRAGRPYVVIDRDEEQIALLDPASTPYVHGDAEEEDTLLQAGIERADGLILTLPEDSSNVFVTLVAREVNADVFILARTNDHKNRRKLIHAGANKVISPDEIGADRMAQVILRPHVDRFMEQVIGTGALGLLVEEVAVEENAPIAGKSLAESHFRQQFDAIVIAILDGETSEMHFNPSARTEITPGDILIVLGSEEMIDRLRNEGCRSAS